MRPRRAVCPAESEKATGHFAQHSSGSQSLLFAASLNRFCTMTIFSSSSPGDITHESINGCHAFSWVLRVVIEAIKLQPKLCISSAEYLTRLAANRMTLNDRFRQEPVCRPCSDRSKILAAKPAVPGP